MLRVATFNVHGGRGDDGVLDLARCAAAINATGARLVALQELDRRIVRSGRVDQPEELSRLTGLPVTFRATMPRGRGEYGIGIAAHGLSEEWAEELPRLSDEEPRLALVARWNGLSVVATHLAWQRWIAARQLLAVGRICDELRPPVIVLGDLNLTRRSLDPLLERGFTMGPRRGTFKSPVVRTQIDYVLAGPGLELTRVDTIESRASDHLPLVGELRRRPRRPRRMPPRPGL
jgi:endonuclease/exonuclease/phosphatase family metal-dependent hydrolase